MRRPILLLLSLLAFVATFSVSPARAQLAVTLPNGTTPQLGEIIAGTIPTTFYISPTGVVTRLSGDAIRLSNAPVAPPTIRITCGLLNVNSLCLTRYVRITVVPQLIGPKANIVLFRAGTLTGATFFNGPPPEASTLNIVLNPMGIGTTTLTFGMTVMVQPGQTGAFPFGYGVSVALV